MRKFLFFAILLIMKGILSRRITFKFFKSYIFLNFEVHAKTLSKESIQWLENKDPDMDKNIVLDVICQLMETILGSPSKTNMALDEDLAGESKCTN